jgi:hypothetical protein
VALAISWYQGVAIRLLADLMAPTSCVVFLGTRVSQVREHHGHIFDSPRRLLRVLSPGSMIAFLEKTI